jgi:succinate dehydrogenase / fumarate reductase membrane anchor subunit
VTAPLSGSRAWIVQRVSALYLLAFLVFALVAAAGSEKPWTYAAWREWIAAPGMRVAALLFFLALLLHAWVGLRDVILDYVHPAAVRSVLLALVAAGELAVGAWVLVIFHHA